MDEPFTLSRRLAIGGTAELWLARTSDGGQQVIKRLFAGHTPEQARRLEVERQVLEVARSPGVVRCLASGEGWLALEWVEGVDAAALATHLSRRGSALSPVAAVHLLASACAGLAAVHRAGFVHGDVAPGNVLLGKAGEVKVGDLGLARPLGGAPPVGEEGTLAYQPPEQLRREPIDASADLFALALVVYELVTGTLARPAGMLGISELLAARAQLPRAPSAVRPGVPSEIDGLLLPALDPDRTRRPRSCEAWLAQIQASALLGSAEALAQAVRAAVRKNIPAAPTALERREPPVEETVLLPTLVSEALMPVPDTRIVQTPDTRIVQAPRRRGRRWWGALGLAVLLGAAVLVARRWRVESPGQPLVVSENVAPVASVAAIPVASESAAPVASVAAVPVASDDVAPATASPAAPKHSAPAVSAAFVHAQPTPPIDRTATPRATRPPVALAEPRATRSPVAPAEPRPDAHPARLAVRAASCPLRVSGHGANALAPTTTAPLIDGVSMVGFSAETLRLRLLLRVTRDAAGIRVSFGAPRGTYYTVGCGGARRTTPLLDVPLTGTLSCEVVTTSGDRCTYALALDRP